MTLDPRMSTGVEIAAAIRSGTLSSRQVTETVLASIETTNPGLNAFTRVTKERAIRESEAVDAAIAGGINPGPLAGVPFAVKNLFDLEGEVTVAGSKINRSHPAVSKDATVVSRLRQAGAICLGTLNMGEFAYDFITNNPHDGPTRNPHDLKRSAGGSSGGSGAAVSAGLCAIALGSDTNGSIRVPSSFCGIWGLKPTYGMLTRGGTFAFVDSLDTIGPFARSVADLAISCDVMSGFDERDPVTKRFCKTQLISEMETVPDNIRIAKLGGYFATGGEPFIHEAVDCVCQALEITQVTEIPAPDLARTGAYLITAAESANRHLSNLQKRPEDFDPVIRDRLYSGALIPAGWVIQAQRFRSWWKAQMRKVFQEVDVLIAPATPIRAPVFGEETFSFGGSEIALRPNIGLFTQPVSFVGLPVVAAPINRSGELPCAVQLIGAPGSEAKLLMIARRLEQSGVCHAPTMDPETGKPYRVE